VDKDILELGRKRSVEKRGQYRIKAIVVQLIRLSWRHGHELNQEIQFT